MGRALRIGVLLVVLVVVAGITLGDRLRTTAWTDPLWIGIFPVDADGAPATRAYLAGLDGGRFAGIESFFAREAAAWDVALPKPVVVRLEHAVALPPPVPAPDPGLLDSVLWSLRMRYFAWRAAGDSVADIRVFVIYHDPRVTSAVPHSVGLQKGLLGVVHAFADPVMDEPNGIVIAHEVMHALGATDKYDPATTLPVHPAGYGEPDAEPRHPQRVAEIMAGRIAVSPVEARMPERFDDVVVGALTAAEIGWPGAPR